MANTKYVHITSEEFQKLKKLSEDISDAKKNVVHYQKDNYKLPDRYLLGLCGELAVEKTLNTPVVEWIADENAHDYPDVKGHNIGVKSHKPFQYPLIPKNIDYPQIFCEVHLNDHDAHVIIEGIATVDCLRSFQDDTLIIDPNVRRNGYKTAFTGFKHLKPIEEVFDNE